MNRLTEKDHPIIEDMIKNENLTNINFLKNAETYIMDDKGFFSYYIYNGNPVLQHFFIKPESRKIENARKLVKGFLHIIKENGHKRFIVSAKKDYLCKIIEYYFKVKSKYSIQKNKYYLVEV